MESGTTPPAPGADASEESWAEYAARLPEGHEKEAVLALMALPGPAYSWEDRRALLEAWKERPSAGS